MGILKTKTIYFYVAFLLLGSCKFADNLLGKEPNIDSNHAPPINNGLNILPSIQSPPASPPPLVISTIADQFLNEDQTSAPIVFNISDTSINCLTDIMVTSSDPTIIDGPDMTFAVVGNDCTVILVPKTDANGGPVQITFTVTDGVSTVDTTFDLTIDPVADPFAIQGEVTSGEVLSVANYGPDFDTASGHQWLADGIPIPGETGPTLTVSAAEEGKTITLELDGSQTSSNELITVYHAIFAHENKATIATSNINGTPTVYENLLNSIDQGGGSIRFLNGPNGNYNKRANSVASIKNPGEYIELTHANSLSFTGYSMAWGPDTSLVGNTIRNRIHFDRGNGSTRFLKVIINGVLEVDQNLGNNGGTYRVTRTTTGFEVTRNGAVLFSN